MQDIIFVHGMFQNPRSWQKWISFFTDKGYNCVAPAWPYHDGDPAALRANPPEGLGKLRLSHVVSYVEDTLGQYEDMIAQYDDPIVIGHSVGGLVAQLLLNRDLVSAAVAISSVAPNRMMEADWSFLKNVATIANPLKGDDPALMDAKTFHEAFANTLSESEATQAFENFATHDSRNVLRDCLSDEGHVDLDKAHAPLLLIGGEKDQIIPSSLVEKNAVAYEDAGSVTDFREFAGRSHYICGERGWEEVAAFIADWLNHNKALFAPALRPVFKGGKGMAPTI
jgi:pimeloyl-ACP methyl ester carboxylesterase